VIRSAVNNVHEENVVKEYLFVWKIQTETGLVFTNEDKYTLRSFNSLPVLEIW
jgi:hypothetical protein